MHLIGLTLHASTVFMNAMQIWHNTTMLSFYNDSMDWVGLTTTIQRKKRQAHILRSRWDQSLAQCVAAMNCCNGGCTDVSSLSCVFKIWKSAQWTACVLSPRKQRTNWICLWTKKISAIVHKLPHSLKKVGHPAAIEWPPHGHWSIKINWNQMQ